MEVFIISVFTISKVIPWIKTYRKPIVVAGIVAVIMGIFVSGGQAYGAIPKDPNKTAVPASTEIEELSEHIKQLVKELEYSDEVAQDFVSMVNDWKDAQGRAALVIWKKKLAGAKEDYKQGKISKDELAEVEESIAKELGQKIQKEISYNEKFFDLADVIKHKQGHCLGYSQTLYVLGNSVGLPIRVINVVELMNPDLFTLGGGHVACIASLASGQTVMVDLVPGGFVNRPFIIENELVKDGNCWALKDKDNPLKIHRRIRILDRDGVVASKYVNRGVANANIGQLTEAVSDCTKAIELDPNYTEAYNNRGRVNSRLSQHTKAISDYTKAIEIDPKYSVAYNNRGAVHYELQQFPNAISDYSKAIELNPRFAAAYTGRGIVYAKLGQFTKAISEYNKAIKLDPKDAKAYFDRGVTYFQLEEVSKVMSDFNKAIELDPNYVDAYFYRGNLRVQLGQRTEAVSDYTKAIEINPNYSEAYKNRGITYAFLGKPEEAKRDLLKAVKLDPGLKQSVRKIADNLKLDLKLD